MTVFGVPGMDRADEVHMVRVALDRVPGVEAVHIDLGSRTVAVTHEGPPDEVYAALAVLGLGARRCEVNGTPIAHLAPTGSDCSERPALISVLIINASMFVVELTAGLLGHSSALVADSIDMVMDASVYVLALTAVGSTTAARRRAARHSGWLQMCLAGLVLVEVVRRAVEGSEPESQVMFVFGALALVAKVASALLLAARRDAGLHVRATLIFSINDAVANLGVMIAATLVAITGSPWPDLVVGAGIALLIAAGGGRILWMARESAGDG